MNKRLEIGIIGAGFTGLTAGIILAEKNYKVTILEKSEIPGGLVIGFKEKSWKWSLERHYHHIFTSDNHIIKLAKKVKNKIAFKSANSSIYTAGSIFRLDSVTSLINFPLLNPASKIRSIITLGFLRIAPELRFLETLTAYSFLKRTMGTQAFEVTWRPLFEGKFGTYAAKISALWFWARIKKRSAKLGYPEGGFTALLVKIENYASKLKCKIMYNSDVTELARVGNKIVVKTQTKQYSFDKVICTLPTNFFLKITKNLPIGYKTKLSGLQGLGAINVVLLLKEKFFKKGVYWLNVNEKNYPFLCIVEHTNFVTDNKYGKDKIIYIGNYLKSDHTFFSMSSVQLVDHFLPYLKKINPEFKKDWIKKAYAFKAPFAQPIVTKNYSKKIPSFITPIKDIYLANIQQVYPWDRGTNYAVELGEKIANLIMKQN